MFVYQNTEGNVCITFQKNRPVENPEYIIVVDKENQTVSLTNTEGANALNEAIARAEKAEADLADAKTALEAAEARITELEDALKDVGTAE